MVVDCGQLDFSVSYDLNEIINMNNKMIFKLIFTTFFAEHFHISPEVFIIIIVSIENMLLRCFAYYTRLCGLVTSEKTLIR